MLILVGCDREQVVPSTAEIEPLDRQFETAIMSVEIMDKWARSCALCHVNGEGGAPRMGDLAVWQERLAQGNATLLDHTLKGYARMPPLGYCMDCEEIEFAAMIMFMSGQNQ